MADLSLPIDLSALEKRSRSASLEAAEASRLEVKYAAEATRVHMGQMARAAGVRPLDLSGISSRNLDGAVASAVASIATLSHNESRRASDAALAPPDAAQLMAQVHAQREGEPADRFDRMEAMMTELQAENARLKSALNFVAETAGTYGRAARSGIPPPTGPPPPTTPARLPLPPRYDPGDIPSGATTPSETPLGTPRGGVRGEKDVLPSPPPTCNFATPAAWAAAAPASATAAAVATDASAFAGANGAADTAGARIAEVAAADVANAKGGLLGKIAQLREEVREAQFSAQFFGSQFL